MRQRSRVIKQESRDWSYERTDWSGGTCANGLNPPTASTYAGVQLSEYVSEFMEDFETPDFHHIKARGGIINSPMNSRKVHVESSAHYYDRAYTGQVWACTPNRWMDDFKQTISGSCDHQALLVAKDHEDFIPLVKSDSSLSTMKAKAITQAWGNIDHSEFLALVSAAELGKTVDGLFMLLKQVKKITTRVARLDNKMFKSTKGEIKMSDLRDIYMQARYGLRPLYYEIRGLLKSIETDLGLEQTRFTFRGHESSLDDVSREIEYLMAASWYGFKQHDTLYQTAHLETNVRAGVLTELDQLTANKLMGISNIAESALELVPYSFIAGWFANVASYISSWAPNVGSKTLASWVTVDQTLSQTTTVGPTRIEYTPPSNTTRATNVSCTKSGWFSQITRTYSREPEPSRPVLPRFDVRLDPLKLLDLGIIGFGIHKNAKLARRLRL